MGPVGDCQRHAARRLEQPYSGQGRGGRSARELEWTPHEDGSAWRCQRRRSTCRKNHRRRSVGSGRGAGILRDGGERRPRPWAMLRALASEEVPWRAVHVFQVDERIAPAGNPDRNLTHLLESLLGASPPSRAALHETQPPEQIYCDAGGDAGQGGGRRCVRGRAGARDGSAALIRPGAFRNGARWAHSVAGAGRRGAGGSRSRRGDHRSVSRARAHDPDVSGDQ